MKKGEALFEAMLITNCKSLEEIDRDIALLLLDESLQDLKLGEKVKKVLYLSEHETNAAYINRYQSADIILKNVLKALETLPDMPCNGFLRGEIIGVYSPVGGSGKTLLAKELAREIKMKGGKVYYFDFGLVPEIMGERRADFYYDLHEKIHITEDAWKNYFSEEEGVFRMASSVYNTELWTMAPEDIEFFLEQIHMRNEEAYYIFDIGFFNAAIVKLLEGCDRWLLPKIYRGERLDKIEHVKELIRFQGREALLDKLREVSHPQEILSMLRGGKDSDS
jgi:hypothetical protein